MSNFDINKLAAEILLQGDDSDKVKQMRQAAKTKVGQHLRASIEEVLKEYEDLNSVDPEILSKEIVDRYLEKN